jgi:glycosyltransferase involved in cell wall biosynthesis
MHGADRLIAALDLARTAGVDASLDIVCREGQEPPGPRPDWVRIRRAEGHAIHALLPDVLATVIPRPRSPYNDLALPIKLFDYLSYGRPILATACVEQARVVLEADCGVVVSDDPAGIATGIRRLGEAAPAELDRWSSHAAAAAGRNSWGSRADQIVAFLTTPRGGDGLRGR